jgi:MOSC domain-containing protein YiiM
LGGRLPSGFFGENLTTAGLDVNEAVIGSHWRIGTVLLQPVEPRIPCSVFKGWVGLHGLDDSGWVRRFAAEGRPGPYLRVLEEGTLEVGDEILVEHVPDHGITVSTMFRAVTTERHLLGELERVEGLSEPMYAAARAYAAQIS